MFISAEPTQGKEPDARKDWRQKEKGQQGMRWLESITDSMDMNLSKLWETVKGAWCAVVQGIVKSWTLQLNNNKYSFHS